MSLGPKLAVDWQSENPKVMRITAVPKIANEIALQSARKQALYHSAFTGAKVCAKVLTENTQALLIQKTCTAVLCEPAMVLG